jgi:hypothetical protein
MEDICKRFPKICNCPYKDDIDNDLKKGKTPYYIGKWLKDTDCPISHDTIRRYQKYLLEHGEIKQETQSPSHKEDNLLTQLEKKAQAALESLDMENISDNVKVQLILGACKLIYGNKHLVDANVDSRVTMESLFDDELIDTILDGSGTDDTG